MPLRINRRHANAVLLGSLITGLTRHARADNVGNTSGTELSNPQEVKYFTPDGGGSHSGHTWQDAMPVDWLERSFPLAEPGTAYYIGFPDGSGALPFKKSWGNLAISGAEGKPIQIRGGRPGQGNAIQAIDATAAPLLKSASPWSMQSAISHSAPKPPLQLVQGASHIAVESFAVDGTGVGGFVRFFVVKGAQDETFEDILIRDLVAQNVGRVIETTHGAVVRHLTVENCSATNIVRGFARFFDLSDSIFRKITLDAGNLNAGIQQPCQLFSWVKGENVVFEDITMKNAVNTALPTDRKSYTQGDGIVTERQTKNVTIRRCHASHMGDGGFDLKTTNVTLEDSSAEDCKFGARIWTEAENLIRNCSFKSVSPVGGFTTGCVQASGRLEIVDTKMEVGPGTCAIELHKLPQQGAPSAKITGGSITIHDGGKLVVGVPGGVLELNNVAINGETKTQRIET